MKILLIYPKYPDTFMSYKHALKFVSKKAAQPPLGLITVASMLPEEWEKRLIDLNVSKLKEKDLDWADYVFMSAMTIQRESVKSIIQKCKKKGVKTVGGGPLFTAEHDLFPDVNHLVLGEAETSLPIFVNDVKRGNPTRVYLPGKFNNLDKTPIPMWNLLKMKKYASLNVQYSRGCPFGCEFCDISVLFGSKVRSKSKDQLIDELESIYATGWRGDIFFVDDNFIGNKFKVKNEILPAMIEWMGKKKHPFSFQTEVSINLADDDTLLKKMVDAGFDTVFVGIETVNEDSLVECGKHQNKKRDMLACVEKIQKSGLKVLAGFIVGFDSDPPSIFEQISAFIQSSGITTAMVGLLNAPRNTKLYNRLKAEGRLTKDISGENTDFSMNFIPKMDSDALIDGYKKIIRTIYTPREYYERVKKFMRDYKPTKKKAFTPKIGHIKTLMKCSMILGVFGKERYHYWKLFFWTLFRRPKLFPDALTCAVYGFHFRKVLKDYL